MQLGSDKGEPLLQCVTLLGAMRWSQIFGRCEVGDALNNGGTFVQAAAIIELQQGYIAQRVDGVVVSAVFQFVGFGGSGNGLKFKSGFVLGDVGRELACTCRVIQFHFQSLRGLSWSSWSCDHDRPRWYADSASTATQGLFTAASAILNRVANCLAYSRVFFHSTLPCNQRLTQCHATAHRA